MPEYLFEKKPEDGRGVRWRNVLIVAICIALVSGIIIGVVCYLYKIFTTEKDDICVTENCLKASAFILSSLNLSEDPCYDFYQFSCGNFIAEAYENNYPSQYYLQRKKNKHKLHSIIAEPLTGNEDRVYLQQKQFYLSCMNVEAIDQQGLEPLQNLLQELGGWPVVKGQDWNENDFNLTLFIMNSMNLGLPFQWFFEVYYSNDELSIDIPILTKHNGGSYGESTYLNLLVETAINFGAANNSLTLSEMESVKNFENKLEILESAEEQESTTLTMNLSSLSSTFPTIKWSYVLNNITENYTVSDGNVVTVSDYKYLQNLNLLLAKTPRRVLANFMVWRIIKEFGFYLSKPIRDNFMSFTNFLESVEVQIKNRFEFCVQEAIDRFPLVAETEFILRSISQEKLDDIKEMISNIKDQYINRLGTSDRIDEDAKTEGINRVNEIAENLCANYLNFDEESVKQFLEVNYPEFVTDNIIDLIRLRNKYSFVQLFDTEYTVQNASLNNLMFFLQVDDDYTQFTDILFFTAGLTRDDFHAFQRPKYLNYGSLGFIVSHEIGHALDPLRVIPEEKIEIVDDWSTEVELEIDETGNLSTENESFAVMSPRTKCMQSLIEDYGDTPRFTEKFADLISIDQVYDAYVAWAEQYEQEQQLPNLPFSPTQLFWIQFGTTNCYRKIDSVSWTHNDGNHDTLRQRVLDILRNSENFAKDFECPEGSVMNPIEKCHLL